MSRKSKDPMTELLMKVRNSTDEELLEIKRAVDIEIASRTPKITVDRPRRKKAEKPEETAAA